MEVLLVAISMCVPVINLHDVIQKLTPFLDRLIGNIWLFGDVYGSIGCAACCTDSKTGLGSVVRPWDAKF